MRISDASHGSREFDYGQTGGLRLEDLYRRLDRRAISPYFLDESQTKKGHVLIIWRKIHSFAYAEDRGFAMRGSFKSWFRNRHFRHEILVDSRALFDAITLRHDCKEYLLRKTVNRIRNTFEAQELDFISCIPVTRNVADALTKRTTDLGNYLSAMLFTGLWMIELKSGLHRDSRNWT